MYRKRNGSLGFSFTRFANTAIPNLWGDSLPSTTTELEPKRRDMLYGHQLASTDFVTLDAESFLTAGVVDHERVSKRVYAALQKKAILDGAGKVNTSNIGPQFINQVAFIDTGRQKQLVNVLFWWEEECHRYKRLMAEDEELGRMIEEARGEDRPGVGDDDFKDGSAHEVGDKHLLDQLMFARERVRMKIRQYPSQRRNDTEADTDNIMNAHRGQTSSAMATSSTDGPQLPDKYNDDQLPEYSLIGKK